MCEQCYKHAAMERMIWLGIARSLTTIANDIAGVVNAIHRRYGERGA